MAKKLKVYFACSIKGVQDGLDTKEVIIKTIQDLGHEVLSEVFLEKDPNLSLGKKLTDQKIYERDMKWVNGSDLIVAALGPSFGVGYEVGWYDRNGGKVVALLRGTADIFFSSMAKGNNRENFHLHFWQTKEELQNILKKELGAINQ